MQQLPRRTTKVDLKRVRVRLLQAHERLRWEVQIHYAANSVTAVRLITRAA